MNCRNFSLTQLNNSRSKNSRLTKVLRIFVIHITNCKNNHKRSRRISFSRRFSKPTTSNTKGKLLKDKFIGYHKIICISKPTTSNTKGKLLQDNSIRDLKRSLRISKPTKSNTKGKLLKDNSIRDLKRSRSSSTKGKLLKVKVLIRIACKTK